MTFEENPFEDPEVAREWIASIENERGLIRDKELYPKLERWGQAIHSGTVVEIGSGQGICSTHLNAPNGRYIGIEPSAPLVHRAKEMYVAPNRDFILGNAYQLPIAAKAADAAFSVNVWFHLENLDRASEELSRILKPGGQFFVSTANPDSYAIWESFYFEHKKIGRRVVGKVNVPINPLSKSVFYQHPLDEIKAGLIGHGLIIDRVERFGAAEAYKDKGLFINIFGHKIDTSISDSMPDNQREGDQKREMQVQKASQHS